MAQSIREFTKKYYRTLLKSSEEFYTPTYKPCLLVNASLVIGKFRRVNMLVNVLYVDVVATRYSQQLTYNNCK